MESLPHTTTTQTSARRALLAILLVAPAPSLGVLAAMYWWPGPFGQAIFFASKLWLVVAPAAWLLLVERQRLSLSPARTGGFGVGIALGLIISALIWGSFLLFGHRLVDFAFFREVADENGIGTLPAYLGAATFWITVNSLIEEYVYRWFLFRQSERLVGTGGAVFLSAIIFTVHHVFALKDQADWPLTIVASLGVFVGGLVWSWMYGRYRSIWPGYVSHAIVDVAVFTVGWWIIFGATVEGAG